MTTEPAPQTQSKPAGPEEPEAILCLGGPKHNRSIAWRGETFEYRERDAGRVHQYRWVKLSLARGELALEKNLYVHDGEEETCDA
jgi:hypothetical protein